jgi:hypothetical protein
MNLAFKKQLLLICLLVLVSCAKKLQLSDQERLNIKIQIARLSDVPMPFGCEPVLDYINEHSFGYLIKDSDRLDLLQYYLVELDQYGWNLIGQFEGLEQNLIFEKPHKLLSIIIRKQEHKYFVLLLSKNK